MAKSNVIDFLKTLDENQVIDIWNEYQDSSKSDNKVYNNDDEAVEILLGCRNWSTTGWLSEIENGTFAEYSSWDNYVTIDGNNSLISSDNIEDLIDYSDLANWIVYSRNWAIDEDDFKTSFYNEMPKEFNGNALIEDYIDENYDIFLEDWDTIKTEILNHWDTITKEETEE